MIRRVLLFAVLGSLCGCSIDEEPPAHAKRPTSSPPVAQPSAESADPIDALVAQLSKSGGIWVNGLSPILDLPETAAIEDVVAEFFQKVSYEDGKAGTPKVEQIRRVTIADSLPNDQYTAVLVDTRLGRKILLLQYSKNAGWWSRVYDA